MLVYLPLLVLVHFLFPFHFSFLCLSISRISLILVSEIDVNIMALIDNRYFYTIYF
jgi:hypothetical protein